MTDGPRVVIVVDFDDAERRKTVDLITQLARAGKHRVTLHATGDGAEALRLIEASPPHLLITEALVPKINGLELVRRVLDLDAPFEPAVIVLSELTAEIDRFWALRNGASEYLTKPCPADLLRDRVLKFFSGSLGTDAALDSWLPG